MKSEFSLFNSDANSFQLFFPLIWEEQSNLKDKNISWNNLKDLFM